MKPHEVTEQNAPKFLDWLENRGGILVWKSHDLGSANLSVSTPATQPCRNCQGRGEFPDHIECVVCKGSKVMHYDSPGWKYPTPSRHVTSIDDVVVITTKVVQSFVVKLKIQGMRIVLTNGSTKRVESALKRHGDKSSYRFGTTGSAEGSTPHALMEGEDTVEILVDDSVVPLREWAEKHKELAQAG